MLSMLWARTALVWAAVALCGQAWNITDREQQDIDAAVADFLAHPDEEMWSVQPTVSPSHPFIFFHQRKAGGSSLRTTLHKAARALKLKSLIPCFDGVSCLMTTFNYLSGLSYQQKPFPTVENTALFAGHFEWGEQHLLARWGDHSPQIQFSCMTNYREPVSRVVSCLYFWHEEALGGACVGDVSVGLLKELLFKGDDGGYSCMNEPFFVMSGFRDRSIAGHLQDSRYHLRARHLRNQSDGHRRRGLLNRGAATILDFTLQHTYKCAPIVMELPESRVLVESRFPDLAAAGGFSPQHDNVGHVSRKCPFPTGANLDVIRANTRLESVLYNAVFTKVQMQLNKLHT